MHVEYRLGHQSRAQLNGLGLTDETVSISQRRFGTLEAGCGT
jgi:hypothetical protein